MPKKYIYQGANISKFIFDKNKFDVEMNNIISHLKFRKKGTYKVHNKEEISRKDITKERTEEWICKITYKEKSNIGKDLGEIIEYQMPLKIQGEKEYSEGRGKVDIVSVNKSKKTIFLIEFKVGLNGENPWKAFLEIYTYYNMLGGKKKASEFLSRLDEKYNGYSLIPVVLFEQNNSKRVYKKMIEKKDIFKAFANDYKIMCYSCKVNDYHITNVNKEF